MKPIPATTLPAARPASSGRLPPADVIFAGGGTGGHLFPGLAVAEELALRRPDWTVRFIGSDREIERRIMGTHGVAHTAMTMSSLSDLRRRPHRFLWNNWRASLQARQLLLQLRPRAVVGLGGFASASLIWAAHRAHVPVVLLEQNAIPGRATCWLAPIAHVVCTTFAESVDWLPTGTPVLVCGNPVRRCIADLCHVPTAPFRDSSKTLLVLGGSLGAEGINTAMMELARRHRESLADWRILHQTGPRQQSAVSETYRELGIPAEVYDFHDDMPALYQQADIVISRAGATTVSELACAGLPTILVPFPHAADNHQRANANAFARQGAAMVVDQAASSPMTAEKLWDALGPLMSQPERRRQMAQAARGVARPDAAARVVELILAQQAIAA